MKIILIFSLVLISIADQFQSGFQKVKFNVATVLDGYSKEFTGILTYSEPQRQFLIWHEHSSQKTLKALFPEDNFYLQIGLNGAVLGLPLQNFVPELNVDESDDRKSIILTLNPDVVKGTTIRIQFLTADYKNEQENYIELMEQSFDVYRQMSFEQFELLALRFEGRIIEYMSRRHDDL